MKYADGDLVFAKVRGYAPWPAKITFSDVAVVFFGTAEFANVSAKNLWPYNEIFKSKFAPLSKASKSKFRKALEEIGAAEANKAESEDNVVVDTMVESIEKDYVHDVIGQENEVVKGGLVLGVSVGSKVITKKKRNILAPRDTNKHLQEDEARNLILFREKIVEEGRGFSCKLCEFASGNRIVAKTHAIHCGVKQQKRRKRPKVHQCTECAESFDLKSYLDKHFRTTHVTRLYECSTCGYTNGIKRNYIKHLRCHDKKYSPGFDCEFCQFKAKDNWHLDKHRLSHFRDTNIKNLNGPLNKFCPITVDVSLTETYTNNLCDTMYKMTISKTDAEDVSNSARDEFDWNSVTGEFAASFNQLGMSDSDWKDWLEISKSLGLGVFEDCVSWISFCNGMAKKFTKYACKKKLTLTPRLI